MIVLSGFWSTVGSIALFIIALSALIVIHEAGHFIAAKSFKVYCSDFSIGFGPKIIKIKRKKGETRFNVGIIPLGGYVSMYGEGVELPDGQKIPKSRSLNGINRWKRAVIMAAGIFMNFVLAYLIFFISASCFPQIELYMDAPSITNNEEFKSQLRVTDKEGKAFEFIANDAFLMNQYSFTVDGKEYATPMLLQFADTENFDGDRQFLTSTAKQDIDGKEVYYVFGVNFQTYKQSEEYSKGLVAYQAEEYPVGSVKYSVKNNKTNQYELVDFNKPIYLPKIVEGKPLIYEFSEKSLMNLKTSVARRTGENKITLLESNLKLQGNENKKIEPLYIGCASKTYWNGWNSFKVAGQQWVNSTGAVAEALGGLFVGKNWDQVGGPLAIFNQTTTILEEFPFNFYLNTWGVISVNLALFNLLPFPGLDGWQLLVTGIEGTVNLFTRAKYRKQYEKGKAKKNAKPEENIENLSKHYDAKLLKQLSELNDNVIDVEKNYFYKFNKKYNHEALVNVFTDPSNESNYESNEEYKYFVDHNKAVQEREEFILLNNLNEVKPYKEWGIPETTKNIVSYIGLGLLMLLAVVIFVMDIIKMF